MRTLLFAALLALPGLAAAQDQDSLVTYNGACDGSAAATLDPHHFVAANDDDNSLRLYRIGVSNPLAVVDLDPTLMPERKKDGRLKEVDIEGAARIGRRIYWIASHGRDKDGNKERSRYRFFATDIGKATGSIPFALSPTTAYSGLLQELIEQLPELDLGDASKLAPEKKRGFNIEGLAAAPDGSLLIGLRNPRPGGKAIVIPFTNPADVLDRGARARFGTPERLALDDRGIRSIERIGDRYVIVAGPFADKGTFALYTWSGPGGRNPRLEGGSALHDLKPEALIATADPRGVYLLSDDGTDACKALTDRNGKTFRGLAVRLAD